MINGTTALLSWLRANTSTDQMKAKTTASGPSTTQRRNAPRRRYEVHGERTCYRCRQTGHYARECPRADSQQLTETKVKTMKNLIRSMTLNERSQFKEFVTRAEKLRMLIKTMTTTERSEFKTRVLEKNEQQEISTTVLSRKTNPRTNPMITAVPPSRETGPHTNQMLSQALMKFAKKQVRCSECGGEHPTRVCIHRSKRLREERERTTRPKTMTTTREIMKQRHTLPKTVRFDAAIEEIPDTQPPTSPISKLVEKLEGLHIPSNDETDDENSGSDTLRNSEESNDAESIETQQPSSQNNEANARLAYAEWLRKTSDNVYMSNRKSMVLKAYIHAAHRRTEAPNLLDSGATENFINLNYAKWLKLPLKRLPYERPLFNVDGSTNKTGTLKYYTDLEVQTGKKRTNMRFFLADLGEHKVILGYPWFAANQPKIDWARGWIDTTQLPLILRSANAVKPQFNPNTHNLPDPVEEEVLYIGKIVIGSQIARQTMSSTLAEEHDKPQLNPIPTEYRRHAKVFSEEAAQRFPESRIWDHAIELKPGAPATLPGKIYALTQLEQAELAKFVKEHLAKGYIRSSKSPYAAPFFFIKKKDGKLRPVQDYRRLNEWTIRNRYPLPLIPQLINRVRGKALFTKFDIRWGYNNVRIKEGDEWKAAFITNEGLYEPTVMFFGLTNSPATFQAMMNAIFEDEIREGWLTVYMDDMLIATPDDPVLHQECVHRVLDKLEKHDLYLKPEKCAFMQRCIEFLGVVLEDNTIQMDPTKIKGVAEWPFPRNPTDIRSFLGFTGFYRYFIPNYSRVARPLLDLTKKATPWVWEEAQTKAFETLKRLMCTEPVLTQPQYDKPFILHTDASAYGMGAILLQEGGINPQKPSKPRLHPIAYYSATLTPTERNYDIYERELLAIIKALQHWRPHLAWTPHPFTLITDHANLTFWKHPRKVNRRVARWYAELQDYWFEIKHIPGKTHTAADFLSRPFINDKGKQDNKM